MIGTLRTKEGESVEGGCSEIVGSDHQPKTVKVDRGHSSPAEKRLGNAIAESIDGVLTELLGKKTTEAIYDFLERKYLLSREDFPYHTDKLFAVLERLFGEKGKTVMSTRMTKRLFDILGLEFAPVWGFEFKSYVQLARKRAVARPDEKHI
jgi:hypothetical protein